MKMVACGLLSVVLGLAGCGKQAEDTSDTAIVGGTAVSTSDAIVKSTVALVSPDGQAFCTGSLVAKRLVITASHCLDGYAESALYVAFGTKAKAGSYVFERLRVARAFAKHERYDTFAMDEEEASLPPNDIGLVALSEDAPVGYTPIKVLNTTDALRVGETLTLAGYGLTHFAFGSSGVLRKVDVKITVLASNVKEIHFGGVRGKSACMGDSGGPAFVVRGGKLALVGVTSRGSSTCSGEGIYTDARYFKSWITERALSL